MVNFPLSNKYHYQTDIQQKIDFQLEVFVKKEVIPGLVSNTELLQARVTIAIYIEYLVVTVYLLHL